MRPPLPQREYEQIFSRVPRLTVEVVIASEDRGVLLARRDVEPCKGTWNIPGGTVRFAEPLHHAVQRVAREELGLTVDVGPLIGYIEYPSHYENGLDCPVGLAFRATIAGAGRGTEGPEAAWFTVLPSDMHEEQKAFLAEHVSVRVAASS